MKFIYEDLENLHLELVIWFYHQTQKAKWRSATKFHKNVVSPFSRMILRLLLRTAKKSSKTGKHFQRSQD